MKEGIIWRVRNGTKVQIWEDPWVLNKESRFITSERVCDLNFVCDLIDFCEMAWNVDVINRHFDDRDALAILAKPLSKQMPSDRVVWDFTKDRVLLRQKSLHGWQIEQS